MRRIADRAPSDVIIETEDLGTRLKTADFRELTNNVALASDHFGSALTERFGGKLAFEPIGEIAVDRAPAAELRPGLYL